jgi:hypothetical protein
MIFILPIVDGQRHASFYSISMKRGQGLALIF